MNIVDERDAAITIDILNHLAVLAFAEAYRGEPHGRKTLEGIGIKLAEMYDADDVSRVLSYYKAPIEEYWEKLS